MSTRIKVLWLIKGLSVGGAEKLLSTSLPYLDRDSFDYQVAYLLKNNATLVPEFEHASIPVFCLNLTKHYDLRIIFKLAGLLREQRIDILHMHLPYAGIIGRFAAVLARVKTVISTEHELLCRQHPITRFGSILTYPLNNATIAVSHAVAHSLQKCGTTRPNSIHVVHNGIDLSNIDNIRSNPDSIKQSLGINHNHLIVGNVAHIRPKHKGHRYLIEAARLVLKQYPETRFVIVGQEKKRGDLLQLKNQAQRLGIHDKIIFTGFRQDAFQIMNAFDIFVLPSIWEAFGIVLLEAMILGKPVVATRVDGIPEIIEHDKNGYLVEPKNPEQLAEKILLLLSDKTRRIRMGENGMQIVRDRFSIQHTVKNIEQLYISVTNNKDR